VDEAGQTYKESFHRIINYGLAVWLPSVADWLDSVVPPVSNDEINRRAANQQKWGAEESGS
jgi:hypothetical protein